MILTDITPDSAKAVAEVERVCFIDPWSEDSVLSLYKSAGSIVLAACEKDNIVGALLARCAADECELYRIAVLPQYRGKGYALDMLGAMKNICRDRGINTVYLEVRRSNEPAIGLYSRFGFQSAGVRKNYYRLPDEDALIYLLKLT